MTIYILNKYLTFYDDLHFEEISHIESLKLMLYSLPIQYFNKLLSSSTEYNLSRVHNLPVSSAFNNHTFYMRPCDRLPRFTFEATGGKGRRKDRHANLNETSVGK